METYALLQHYWWLLVSVLGALLVFLLFVQGGQTLIYTLGKTDVERKMIVNSLGRKWEFTFTTLVTFGGAFFASFPLFYSTSFGGAYWAWMIILFCFVLQAVSYEYRSKAGNILGQRAYDYFLFINGFLGTILLGAVVSTLFTGSEFIVNKANLTNIAAPTISVWQNPLHGIEALFNLRNILLGLAVFFLSRTLASLYFINNIKHDAIIARTRKQVLFNALPFVVFFLAFFIWTLVAEGYAVNPDTGEIFMQPYKYLINLVEMPVVGIVCVLGVLAVLAGIILTLLKPGYRKGIWFTGTGTVLTVLALLLIAGWNNTAYYPSTSDIQSSLTIYNSSSSLFTLRVMSYVSILIPFVLAYIFHAWKSIDNKPIDEKEMETEQHTY